MIFYRPIMAMILIDKHSAAAGARQCKFNWRRKEAGMMQKDWENGFPCSLTFSLSILWMWTALRPGFLIGRIPW